MNNYSFLIIQSGEPYKQGERIQLSANSISLGRSSKSYMPDISFNSLYVSRKHAEITYQKGYYYLTDLSSTHGTQINDASLKPYQPHKLVSGDLISLVNGLVKLTFTEEIDTDNTINLPRAFFANASLSIDLEKKQIFLYGDPLNISGKPRDLLFLLYENKNKAVSYDDIKRSLWSERHNPDEEIPDVSNDELYAVVYRLRKHLGNLGESIITIPKFGIILTI